MLTNRWRHPPAPARQLFIAGEAPRPGAAAHPASPLTIPGSGPALLLLGAARREVARAGGGRAALAFAFARRSVHPRAPARGPRAGVARGSLRGLLPRWRERGCGLRWCPPPAPARRHPARPAAHLTLCRAPARGHGGAAAPPPADFLRRGARETTARGLPAAPGGQGAGAGVAAQADPGRAGQKLQKARSWQAEEERRSRPRPPPRPRPRSSSYPPAPPWHLCSGARAGAGPWPRRLVRSQRAGAGRAEPDGARALAPSLSLEAGPVAQLTFAGQSSQVPWPGACWW